MTQPKLHNSFLFSSEGLDVQEETLGDTFHYDPLVNDEEIPRDSKSMFKTTLICMTQTWKKILLKSNTRSQPHIFLIFCILIMRTWRIERQTNWESSHTLNHIWFLCSNRLGIQPEVDCCLSWGLWEDVDHAWGC